MRSSRRRIYAKSYRPPHKRYSSSRRGFLGRVFSALSLIKLPGIKKTGEAEISIDGVADNSLSAPANDKAPSYTDPKPGATTSVLTRVLDIAMLALIAGCGVFLALTLLYSDASINVSYTNGGVTHNIKTKCGNVGELLERNGLTLEEGYTLNYDMDEPLEEGMQIMVTQAFPVAVASGGEVSILRMQGGSVADALSLADITYGANDEITRLPFEDVEPGMHIQHISVEIKYETKDQTVGYKEQIIKDESRYKGDDRIKVEGEDGERRIVRRLIYYDGELFSREIMNQLTLKETIDQVKIVGTKIRYQTNLSGDTREWKAAPKANEIKQTMTASEVTAYTHTGRRTATGRWPKVGYVAVNPNIIPYGTKLYIPGYGYCTAQDTGAFRFEENGTKNQLDLFMNTEQECKKWGRKKNIKFYILK